MWSLLRSELFASNMLPSLVRVAIIGNGEKLCLWVCFHFFFFLNFMQNQAPQIIVGMDRLIDHIRVFSIIIRTTINNFQKVVPALRKPGLKF